MADVKMMITNIEAKIGEILSISEERDCISANFHVIDKPSWDAVDSFVEFGVSNERADSPVVSVLKPTRDGEPLVFSSDYVSIKEAEGLVRKGDTVYLHIEAENFEISQVEITLVEA